MALVLLVDRDTATLAKLASPLVDLGYTTFAAIDAGEAEQVFKSESLDLVLVSLRLGSTSGLALLERCKKWNPQVAVILPAHDRLTRNRRGISWECRGMPPAMADRSSLGAQSRSCLASKSSAMTQRLRGSPPGRSS